MERLRPNHSMFSNEEFMDQPIFSASDLLEHRKAAGAVSTLPPPESAILCFHAGALRRAVQKRRVQKLAGFLGEAYLLREAAGRIALVGNFGVGAPGAVVLLEDLAAFGVERFIGIGVAGGLQNSLHTGDLVICDRAICDEGTSRHYLEPAESIEASLDLSALLYDGLTAKGYSAHIGTTWTTDAPYRERRRDVLRHQQAGVKTVEMEAAALFAAGKALQVQVGAAFVIGDSLADLQWRMMREERKVILGLETLIEAAIFALIKMEKLSANLRE